MPSGSQQFHLIANGGTSSASWHILPVPNGRAPPLELGGLDRASGYACTGTVISEAGVPAGNIIGRTSTLP